MTDSHHQVGSQATYPRFLIIRGEAAGEGRYSFDLTCTSLAHETAKNALEQLSSIASKFEKGALASSHPTAPQVDS